jgi:hypothetical protein
MLFSATQVKLLMVAALAPYGCEALDKCRPLCNVGDNKYVQADVEVTVNDGSGQWYVSHDNELHTMQS